MTRAAAPALAACLLAGGCGGGDERAASTPSPIAASRSEQENGGPGDERPMRYRTRLTIGSDGSRPVRVAVRGDFALEFVIRNDTGRRHRVSFAGREVSVPGHRTRALRTGGVRPGRHVLRAGEAGRVEVLAAPPGEP